MGNIDNGYQATVVLRIADVFGDYVELRYSVIVSMFCGQDSLKKFELMFIHFVKYFSHKTRFNLMFVNISCGPS